MFLTSKYKQLRLLNVTFMYVLRAAHLILNKELACSSVEKTVSPALSIHQLPVVPFKRPLSPLSAVCVCLGIEPYSLLLHSPQEPEIAKSTSISDGTA